MFTIDTPDIHLRQERPEVTDINERRRSRRGFAVQVPAQQLFSACQFLSQQRHIAAAQVNHKPAFQFCGTISTGHLVDFRDRVDIHNCLLMGAHKGVGILPVL
jgi:hypothetical protein